MRSPGLRGGSRRLRGGAHLAELDEELRRVGRKDEHVRVGLDEDAGVFLVDLADGFADVDGFGDAGVEVEGLAMRVQLVQGRRTRRGRGRWAQVRAAVDAVDAWRAGARGCICRRRAGRRG